LLEFTIFATKLLVGANKKSRVTTSASYRYPTNHSNPLVGHYIVILQYIQHAVSSARITNHSTIHDNYALRSLIAFPSLLPSFLPSLLLVWIRLNRHHCRYYHHHHHNCIGKDRRTYNHNGEEQKLGKKEGQ